MSLVGKVRSTAGNLVDQAKTKYADSEAMQRAGQQAGGVAQKAGKQAGDAAVQVAGRLKGIATKASSAAKDARSRGSDQR